MKQLEAVESKVTRMKSSSGLASSIHSHTHSDMSDLSRPESATPDREMEDYDKDKSKWLGTEGKVQEEPPSEGRQDGPRSRGSSGNRSGTQSPMEDEKVSLPSVSSYYSSSFTESMESKASEILSVDGRGSVGSGAHTPEVVGGEAEDTVLRSPSEIRESLEVDESGEEQEGEETLTETRFLEGLAAGKETEEQRQEEEGVEREEELLEKDSEHATFVEEEIPMEEEIPVEEDGDVEEYSDLEASVHYDPASGFGDEDKMDDSHEVASLVGSTSKLPSLHNDEEGEEENGPRPERSNSDRSDYVMVSSTPSIGGDTDEQDNFQVGNQVLVGNKMMGVVRFVGHTHFSPGLWVGVEIGVPKGRNDGSIDGQRYFTCDPQYGLFAPPHKLTVIGGSDAESSTSEDFAEEVESETDGEEVEDTAKLEEERLEDNNVTKQEVEKYEEEDDERKPAEKKEEQTSFLLEESEEHYFIQEEEEGEGGVDREGEGVNRNVSSSSFIREDIPTGSHGTGADALTPSVSSEHPVSAAPSDTQEEQVQGEKHDSLPLAPEVVVQRSQSATPTPAPPPEFAEGASRESSSEPQSGMVSDTHKVVPLSERNSISNRLTEELAQDLTNEAYETMYQIWRAKQHYHPVVDEEEKEDSGEDMVEEKTVMDRKKKFQSMSLEEKAELITDQLMSVLLKSESHFACDVHSSKKVSTTEPTRVEKGIGREGRDEKVLNGHMVLPADSKSGFSHATEDEVWPNNRTPLPPPPHLVIHASPTSGIALNLDTPPLSPPFSYRSPPPPLQGINSGYPLQGYSDYSPPGSPPRHLSQASAARVAAGEKSPPPPLIPPSQASSPPLLERSTSVESVVQLLDTIKITTAQCMVPSQRETVDQIVACAWDEASRVGSQNLHSIAAPDSHHPLPGEILTLIRKRRGDDDDEEEEDGMSPAEMKCRDAYVGLVYRLSLEMIQRLHPVKEEVPVWARHCTTRSLLVPTHFSSQDFPSLVDVQKRVYAGLMRGQVPNQLPNVKFLHKMKRPGGREVDFVDQVLIQELRREEPEWVDYSKDEMSVKEKTADALLESLVAETADILSSIAEKRRVRELNRRQQPFRTPS